MSDAAPGPAGSADAGGDAPGPAGSAHAGDLETLERAEGDLDDLDHALRRLDAGTYGRCEVCGAQLDGAELEAAPLRRRCPAHRG